MIKYFFVFSFLVCSLLHTYAQKQATGSVNGNIIEKNSQKPLEFANVIIQTKLDSITVQTTVTDSTGKFTFLKVPYGDYNVVYSFIGFENATSPAFKIDDKNMNVNLTDLYIVDANQSLNMVVVTGEKSTYVSSIDRKTFNVGSDLAGKTGSAGDLLQSIPSVTVDIDGNVALRGSENVMILINGKPSALMGANRAAALQQIPSSSIEKIEVITNPSAKFKPDGTSGIINIVLKKDKTLGLNGTAALNVGNDNRINGNITANYNPGKLNIFASYSIRQDDRKRSNNDSRSTFNLLNDSTIYSSILTTEHSRPLTNIVSTGLDYKVDKKNQVGITGDYNYRSFTRTGIESTIKENLNHIVTNNFDRNRLDPEYEKDLEMSANYTHSFKKEDHEISFDFTTSTSAEQEHNHYINVYDLPVIPTSYDNTLIKQGDKETQFTIDYTNPLSEDKTLESGYIYESGKSDMNYFGEFLNPTTNLWEKDFTKSNRFIYSTNIHVLYTTYEQEIGKFGFLAGLRAEQAAVNANQVTIDSVYDNNYFRLYPTLHLSYDINKTNQLQLNYSHRVNRPDGEDTNPFPEYQDPLNLRKGNPHLKPEDIHSVELGYQFKKDKTTFLSTIYYRYTYNKMTFITKYMNDSVLVTTFENLDKSSSAGLELVLTSTLFKIADINLSTNTFYNTIDASNLGYSNNKSVLAFTANFSSSFKITKSSVLQVNSNYSSETLTPQGKRLPTFVANLGFKQELFKKKIAAIVTVSDVFNSMRYATITDTPELYQKLIRRRTSRMIFFGLSYNFGKQSKKQKDNAIKFDNQL